MELKTWTQNEGLNPRTNWDIDWQSELEKEHPLPVSFNPFVGLWPIYADCYDVTDGIAILKVPPKSRSVPDDMDWFPIEEPCWIAVSETYIRPQ